jgi:hypothetical protein
MAVCEIAWKCPKCTSGTAELPYCNSLVIGLPSYLLNQLQRIQNTAAGVVTKTKKFNQITQVRKDLHWLPVSERIVYKVLLITYKALHGEAPQYISQLITPYVPSRHLRSSSRNLLEVVRVKTKLYGARSFAAAAPVMWNSLPCHIRDCDNINVFKSNLKTFLFSKAYF